MNRKLPLMVAGLVFTVVAIVHALRLYFGWDIQLAGMVIPMSASIVGFALSFFLACWMFFAARGAS